MSTANRWHVGQEVTVLGDRTNTKATVVKVGRTVVTVKMYAREYRYDIETGSEKRGPKSGGVGTRILTDDDLASQQRRTAARERLAELGIRFDWHSRQLKTETLEKIADLVQAEEV